MSDKPRNMFDEAYYKRFYNDDPVHTQHKVSQLALGLDALFSWWDFPVQSVLDVGAGPGYWRDWYKKNKPQVKVVSTDISEYACKKYGHERRDIATWRPPATFDFVICHGVLHYLSGTRATAAIQNLAHACRGLMYMETPTTNDLLHTVDRDVTDLQVYSRSATWYRSRLRPHFQQVGAGLWMSHKCKLPFYELEIPRRVTE